jgi:ABC-type transport system substrate-binding protein
MDATLRPCEAFFSFSMNRRVWNWLMRVGGVAWAVAWAVAPLPAGAAEPKVLRYAFEAAESGFDPAQISDLYSATVVAHIFEGLFDYDYLARPYKVRPTLAADLPEASADFRTWTVRVRPGIYFADDPAFKGRRRELVAQDFVYSFKRYFDPAVKSPGYSGASELGVVGIEAVREQSLKRRQPFDYDREVAGVRALDRHTLQFKLKEPRPRFLYALVGGDGLGVVAREVVEAYGDKIAEHPVGTGPFRLAAWRRSSLIRLERNPGFREELYAAEPNADDAEGQALLKRFAGRRLPLVDAVEVSIVNESQPRWLAFLNGQFDLLAKVPLEFATLAAPQGELAPNLAKRGIRMQRILNPDRTYQYFNMDDPLVGGYTPEKVALRRAISLATDIDGEIATVRRGQAIPAQSMIAPGSWGYDPALKTELSDFSPARAQALLDLFGYVDRDGDGWREQPDGQPLVLEVASQPDPLARAFDEHWKKNLDAVGLRLRIQVGQWPEQLKAAYAGQLMMWSVGSSEVSPDPQNALSLLYGPASGAANMARFRLPAYDRVVQRMQSLPDGPERLALLREAQQIAVAYMPYKVHVHRIVTDLTQARLVGYRRPIFSRQFWQYVDLEDGGR